MKKINVALLGIGNVGTGVYKILTGNNDDIKHKEDMDISVKKILVRDINKKRNIDADKSLYTTDFEEIVNDEEIDIIAEFMGGVEPARTYIIKALESGKTVVTANKEVLAKHWPVFEEAAKKTGAGLYYEASVAGGIPIIRAITESMQANNIDSVMGIINGTTNYILTEMSEKNASYEDVLKEAQKQGLAEPDPTNDVEGYDAAYKLSILASLAFHSRVHVENIYVEGITKINAQDISWAKELGYTIKLLAIGKKNGNVIEARVHPALIKSTHPLASVRGAYNAIFLHGHALGDFMLYGKGAGELPTASAIVSDIIFASNTAEHRYTTFENTYTQPKDISFNTDWASEYFIHLRALDKPGVLSQVAGIFGNNGVSIAAMMQKQTEEEDHGSVPLVFIIHETNEHSMKKAIDEIKNLEDVVEVVSLLRVMN